MNELKINNNKTKAKIITIPEIISISISLIAVMVSLLMFFLPFNKKSFYYRGSCCCVYTLIKKIKL